MSDIINKVEAVLFASGKPVLLKDLKRITKESEEDIIKAIDELKTRYDANTSIMIVETNESWKMTIREKYVPYIRKIVTETELSKTVMETLAVVAWKSPVTQSDVIKIRTNKAYDHLTELEDSGFITTAKHGRTKLLRLTTKFYEYFDVDNDRDIKKILGQFNSNVIPQKQVLDFEEKDNESVEQEEKADDNFNLAEETQENISKLQEIDDKETKEN